MNGTGDVLRRFHQVLVEEISEKRPEYLGGPFTVAEIYQNLVPYGTHRDRLGIEMNGDYEDALLRLLAGEGGFLRLESEHALHQLRQELESANPNTGLYRDFAAVDVRLGQPAGAEETTGPGGDASAESASAGSGPTANGSDVDLESATGAALGTKAEGVAADARTSTGVVGDSAPEAGAVPSPGEVTEACPWCRAQLPRRSHLHFCPFCGTDIQVVPCRGCGEELERDWRFCIACGLEITG